MTLSVDGGRVAILEGYPPDSVYKQAIYTTRSGMARTQVPEEEVAHLWSKAQATGLLQPAGNQLKCLINRAFTEQEVQEVLRWFDDLAGTVAKFGLK